MIRASILILLTALGLHAQLVLQTPDGTVVGSNYNLGQVPAGVSKQLTLHAVNTGAAAIPITQLGIAGEGFSITSPPTPPPNIAPNNFLDLVITFSGGPPASYSANFQINTTSVILVIQSVAAATLSVVSGCTGPDPTTGVIGFGQVQVGQSVSCVFSLRNLNAQSLTVSTVSISATPFALSKPVLTPLTLAPGAGTTFGVNFAPTLAAVASGSLTIDSQAFALSGTGVNAPLPVPILEFDSGAPASGQQRTITMRLPTVSPLTASGSVNLSFRPDTSVVSDDPAIVFVANGARSIPFTIHPGDININLGNLPGAVFQTGTTSGKVSFTVSINVALAGDPTTTMVIPPAIISAQTVSAIARTGALDVQVFGGFDNTYSAGKMSFTFYNVQGNVIQPQPVTADFSSAFHSYFTSEGGGSAFQMLVSFPVTGQANQIGAVDFAMTNSAGSTATQHLNFINDTGQCITVTATLVECPVAPTQ
jgi:hypothetical protein